VRFPDWITRESVRHLSFNGAFVFRLGGLLGRGIRLFGAGLLECPDRLLRGEQHGHCSESKAKGHARLPESSI
jgi:hypothetical protein